jgi:hypothetical protein
MPGRFTAGGLYRASGETTRHPHELERVVGADQAGVVKW